MKKTKKLVIKKLTLRNLDEPALDQMAGGKTEHCTEKTKHCTEKTHCHCGSATSTTITVSCNSLRMW